jgi:PAS domain-containing protein
MKIEDEKLKSRIAELEKEVAKLSLHIAQTEGIQDKSYHLLFGNSLDGFALCKMIYQNEKPVDFVYLSVNPSFERIIGLKNVENKRFTELFPNLDPIDLEFINTYGSVASSGSPQKFERFFSTMSRWLSVSVICPQKGYFVAIFEDVTDKT